MKGRFEDKVAVVTGAASGIGEATARALVREGASVVIADVQAERGEALARELGRARFIQTDVTVEAQVERAIALAVEAFGRIDVMVNNAGVIGAVGSIQDTTAEAWNATLAVLVNGAFFGIKHAARRMVPQGGGAIISISSTAGAMGGLGPHAYTTAKHAIIGLTRSAASELVRHGVRVNAVGPGSTATPLVAAARGGDLNMRREGAAAGSPLGALLSADEIAAGIAYLASDDARHVNGHTLFVDNGATTLGPTAVGQFHDRPAGFVGGGLRTA